MFALFRKSPDTTVGPNVLEIDSLSEPAHQPSSMTAGLVAPAHAEESIDVSSDRDLPAPMTISEAEVAITASNNISMALEDRSSSSTQAASTMSTGIFE